MNPSIYIVMMLLIFSVMNMGRSSGAALEWTALKRVIIILVVVGALSVGTLYVALFYLHSPGAIAPWEKGFPWKEKDRRFGVKVVPWFADDYQIVFTNDGWITSEQIKIVPEWKPYEVVEYFGTKQECIALAKKYTSYEMCLLNNKNAEEKVNKKDRSELIIK